MNEAAPVSGRWSAFKWVAAIVLVFAAHIGFIFAFGSRIQPVPREAPRQPSIRYVTADPDWLELTDTMLFARPHSKRFAGATWMKLPEISQPHFEWKSTAEPLPLDPAGLGEIFSRTGNDAPGLPGHFFRFDTAGFRRAGLGDRRAREITRFFDTNGRRARAATND